MTTFLLFTHDGIKHLNLILLFMGIHIHITPHFDNFSFFSEKGLFFEKVAENFPTCQFLALDFFGLKRKFDLRENF